MSHCGAKIQLPTYTATWGCSTCNWGLSLTDSNYSHSVTSLKERFGQQHILIDALMEALLNMPMPSNTLTNLQSFYDTIQNHMRALLSLGKSPDSYGSLLTSVILGKLLTDIKTHMAHDHYNSEWTIDGLSRSILKERGIFEVSQHSGQRSNSGDSPISTTSSFYMAINWRVPQTHNRTKKDPVCVFCKGTHKTNSCTAVTCSKKHLAIVKSNSLCFNCLACHKVSQCNSRFNCWECTKKHHTSLCHVFATNTEPP